jgi:molecular chaperone DnaK (HSP70)
MSRYLVGIDLGTTNSVVYYVDRESDAKKVVHFPVLQLTTLGEVEKCATLPSFVYLTSSEEQASGNFALPWDSSLQEVVGVFAVDASSESPLRVVSSSKSWLCADNVDRLSSFLPLGNSCADGGLSPVVGAQAILNHIVCAWNYEFPESPLADQEVMLTVPASFDAVARELTLEAAGMVDLSPTLLEEPLAAFYSWLHEHEVDWRQEVEPGDVILVCDVGGGTTDFSLIACSEVDGNLALERTAVGHHILLGGDNVDLALAYMAMARFKEEHGVMLSQVQLSGLTHLCRKAKEVLLGDSGIVEAPLTILGSGSSVIGGALSVTLTKEEVLQVVLEGFFPQCEIGDEPKVSSSTGLKHFGLNYAADSAITKYLSEFVLAHVNDSGMPTCILFNGGTTKPPVIRQRVLATISGWLEEGSVDLRVLTASDSDLAVAAGSCVYAQVKHGHGLRVKSGSAQTYYVGIESSMPAIPGFTPPVDGLCVVPFGMEEGSVVDIPYDGLGLVVGRHCEFQFFTSADRSADQVGELVGCDDLQELASVSVELLAVDEVAPGSLIPVKLRAELTETGLLQLWCVRADEPEQKWKLAFDVRHEVG